MRATLHDRDFDELARSLLVIGAEAELARRSSDFLVDKKGDGSPVTNVDKTVQKKIIALIRHYFGADMPILAEEASKEILIDLSAPPRTYVTLDPVDGTSPLASGDRDSWNVALSIVVDGKPSVALIVRPMYQDVIVATQTRLYRHTEQGRAIPIKPFRNPHKMWAMDMATGVALDPQMMLFNMRIVADRSLGGYPSNVPSIESGLRVILGQRKFFVTGNAMMWDIAPIVACVRHLTAFNVADLRTGQPLDWSRPHREKLPLLAITESPVWVQKLRDAYAHVEECLQRRPEFASMLTEAIAP